MRKRGAAKWARNAFCKEMNKLAANDMPSAAAWVYAAKRCPSKARVKRQKKKLSPERELRPDSAWRIYATKKISLPTRAASFKQKKRVRTRIASRLSLVPVAGVEPAPCCQDWILSPARLPIPSHRQNTFYIIQDLPPKSKQKIRPSATRHKKFVCRAPRIATWPLQTNDRERRPPANEYRRPGFSSGCSCV